MSSGHGISGGVGRCYPFFAEFKECLVSLIGSGEAGCVKQSTKSRESMMFMSVTLVHLFYRSIMVVLGWYIPLLDPGLYLSVCTACALL